MDKVLIDSDVILDALFDREPFSEYATEILSMCEARKIKGFLTPVTYSNIYYLLRKVATHEKVIVKLKQLLLITEVLPMNKKIVQNALNSQFKDFEDSLQNAAAELNGSIEVILTRNLKDYKKSKIGVFTPESYLKSKNSTR